MFRNYDLRKHTYAQIKDGYGLAAQAAQHVIKKVADAYTTLQANIRAGNLGKPGSARRERAESKPIVFRPDAAQPFDDRCLSWQFDARTVSIWTDGRADEERRVHLLRRPAQDAGRTTARASPTWSTATACGS